MKNVFWTGNETDIDSPKATPPLPLPPETKPPPRLAKPA